MANVLIENSTMQDIADAIREKDGSSATMLPSAMAAKILAIPSGGSLDYFEGDVTLVEPSGRLRIDHTLSGNKFLVLAEYDGEIVPPENNNYIISYAYADFVNGASGRDACILVLRIEKNGNYTNNQAYNSVYVVRGTGYISIATNNTTLDVFCPGKWHCIVVDITYLFT